MSETICAAVRVRFDTSCVEACAAPKDHDDPCFGQAWEVREMAAENAKLRAVVEAARNLRAAMDREGWSPPVGPVAWWANELRTALTTLDAGGGEA